MNDGLRTRGAAAEAGASAATTELLDRADDLIVALERAARQPRERVLHARRALAGRVAAGAELEVSAQTEAIRTDPVWQVAPAPAELTRRQVELSTPATADHARTAATSGADVWVADLEDALVPGWEQLSEAYRVIARWAGATELEPEPGTAPKPGMAPGRPALAVRPRGLHLDEAHLHVDGAPVSAAVADVAITLATTAPALLAAGRSPHLYLPKVEGHDDALWWELLLSTAEGHLGLAAGTVRVSVLVETVTAAYQLEEILHALRHRATGLAAGRWDYVFSHLRTYATRPDQILPDLESFTMNTRFLRSYTDLLVRTCHRRGAQAIGGPVTLVPTGPFDPATLQAQARLTRDKTREARQGFDGAWVRHPGQVPAGRAPFAAVTAERDRSNPTASGQAGEVARAASPGPVEVSVDAAALRDVSGLPGTATLTGLRSNLRAALGYLAGWFGGAGTCVVDGHLQDIGTVELARFQIWQWRHHRVRLAEGPEVTPLLLSRMIAEEVAIAGRTLQEDRHLHLAERLLTEAILTDRPPAFLATQAYRVLIDLEAGVRGSNGANPAA